MKPETTEDILELMEGYIVSAALGMEYGLGTAGRAKGIERRINGIKDE